MKQKQHPLRRLLISIIAISLFYQVLGYQLVFNANELLCKKEMKLKIKRGLSRSEKHYFAFSTEEFEDLDWKNEKEFVLNGVMYDIIEKIITRDSISISCIDDKQESKLFANLSKQIDQNSDLSATGKPISKVLLKLLKIEGLFIKKEYCVVFTAIENPYTVHLTRNLTDFSNIDSPPPKSYL